MGSDGRQVVLNQLATTAIHWQGLGAQLTATTPPPPGQPFQPTTAAVSSINARIRTDAAAFATRTQETAGQVTKAAACRLRLNPEQPAPVEK
ncbi:MAG: hypothetical protein EPN51_16855 [Mycobacterium sp.]|nr:MAG: hypothetical protein EPN51_16855 [Mycobacterium sp.]